MTSVSEKNKWKALAFSTLIRFSFHTYQGLLWALVIGVIYGLFYYFMYKKVVKNLLPFFPHACLGRYVWLESHVSLNQLGKLIL